MALHIPPSDPAEQLDQLLADAGLSIIQVEQNKRFIDYLALIIRWNTRTNLTATRDSQSILRRHIVESIACAHALPAGIATLLDFGSGAGFPGIPIAICRPEIAVTLAESQGKKAAFLHEAVRVTGIAARVHPSRAETLNTTFDCVTLRAVDRMEQALAAAAHLVASNGWLAPLTTRSQLPTIQAAVSLDFSWSEPISLPLSTDRILALAHRTQLLDPPPLDSLLPP
ncbi:MAG: 16S rRNA (guanine(527)-N(7))-methyltransferase RsmG [Terracidiphilus sp.]